MARLGFQMLRVIASFYIGQSLAWTFSLIVSFAAALIYKESYHQIVGFTYNFAFFAFFIGSGVAIVVESQHNQGAIPYEQSIRIGYVMLPAVGYLGLAGYCVGHLQTAIAPWLWLTGWIVISGFAGILLVLYANKKLLGWTQRAAIPA
jgi:hypothetical protein